MIINRWIQQNYTARTINNIKNNKNHRDRKKILTEFISFV
jgi:hypothetical protein